MWVDFFFTNQYREGLEFLFSSLNGNYQLVYLDNEGEQSILEKLLPAGTEFIFNQNQNKVRFYKKTLQDAGHNVMMGRRWIK
jgi:Cu+-exporting ATPase